MLPSSRCNAFLSVVVWKEKVPAIWYRNNDMWEGKGSYDRIQVVSESVQE